MKFMSIDIETYSDIDINKAGVYRYVDTDAFKILLFAYSVDGGPVQLIDLTRGDSIPKEIVKALSDKSVTKWAYNANFERVALSRFLGMPTGQYLDPEGWKCSMVWAATLGLPMGLAKVGEVLALDKQKMSEGRGLIYKFCKPDKKTGQRVMPEEFPEDWETFRRYNIRDVETEMGIQKMISPFPCSDELWQEYWTDQRINDRGVEVDLTLAKNAVAMDAEISENLMEKMRSLTGIDNPRSTSQLDMWLREHGCDMVSLGKKDVAQVIEETDDPLIRKVLSLRLLIAKSSVKKYTKMLDATCSDGRARGMFQFYGAMRTGRFAGRLLQLQNLPQNHIENIELVRELARRGDLEALSVMFDSVPDILSQLIRTAFVAREGSRFIVADFSAIEARVIAWLAGEEWRMKAFADGKDIYCASASAMFGVPVVKHGINGELRQKGKVAELACIAEGQLVLTNHGEKTIETVTTDDLVWDGEQWVAHEGVIYRGIKEVMTYEGLTATPDHLVYVEGQKEPMDFRIATTRRAHLIQTAARGAALWLGEDHISREKMERKIQPLLRADRMHRMPRETMDRAEQSNCGKIERLPELLTEESYTALARQETNSSQTEMHKSKGRQLQKLRRQRDRVQVRVCHRRGTIHSRKYGTSTQGIRTRSYRYQWQLRARKSEIYIAQREPSEQALNRSESLGPEILAVQLQRSNTQAETRVDQTADHSGREESCQKETQVLATYSGKTRVYDIRNAGPHHRYTVSGKLVHNCGYGGSVGALKAFGADKMGLTETEMQSIVDNWRASSPRIVQLWWNVDRAIKQTLEDGTTHRTHGLMFSLQKGILFIRLPSGRSLAYVKPRLIDGKITYEGVSSNKGWARLESYGPKFVENCLAEGTQVLTDRGWIEIQNVTTKDALWDGEQWVSHEGLINKGIQEVINIDGALMTPDHKVLTQEGWKNAPSCKGLKRYEVKQPNSDRVRRVEREEIPVEGKMRLWERVHHDCRAFFRRKAEILRLLERKANKHCKRNPQALQTPFIPCLAFNEGTLHGSYSSSLGQLWRQGNQSLRQMARIIREFLGGYVTNLPERANAGQNRREWELHSRELQMGGLQNPVQKQTSKYTDRYTLGQDNCERGCRSFRNRGHNAPLQNTAWLDDRYLVRKTGLKKQVYDLKNAGPNHRFTIKTEAGPMIVHNCVQAISRDLLLNAMKQVGPDARICMHIHDELVIEADSSVKLDDICKKMAQVPEWADGLLLRADGYETKFYLKD